MEKSHIEVRWKVKRRNASFNHRKLSNENLIKKFKKRTNFKRERIHSSSLIKIRTVRFSSKNKWIKQH